MLKLVALPRDEAARNSPFEKVLNNAPKEDRDEPSGDEPVVTERPAPSLEYFMKIDWSLVAKGLKPRWTVQDDMRAEAMVAPQGTSKSPQDANISTGTSDKTK